MKFTIKTLPDGRQSATLDGFNISSCYMAPDLLPAWMQNIEAEYSNANPEKFYTAKYKKFTPPTLPIPATTRIYQKKCECGNVIEIHATTSQDEQGRHQTNYKTTGSATGIDKWDYVLCTCYKPYSAKRALTTYHNKTRPK